MSEKTVKKDYGGIAMLPLVVFLVLYVGCGLVFAVMGEEKPFYIMPRYVAAMAGILVAIFCYDREKKVSEKADIFYQYAGAPIVAVFGMVILLAGGFAGACNTIGGKSSMANLGASLIPSNLLIPGIFIMCAIMATCVGSSMSTASLMAPMAAAMAESMGLNMGLAAAAVMTGAMFGDNLSMISDTTIMATRGVGAEMRDKFKMNLAIALSAAVVTVIIYTIISAGSVAGTAEIGEYNLITILPYFAVLIMAVVGVDIIVTLTIGLGLSCLCGIVAGTAGFFTWAQGVGSGMEDMFWAVVFVMMISGLLGMIRHYGGIDWFVKKMTGMIKGRRSCEVVISLSSLILGALITNNTISIMVNAPVAKELGEKYKIAPKRLASLLDIGACIGPSIMPHGTVMLMVLGYMNCSYTDVVQYEYYSFLLFIALMATIGFGLLRTKEEKQADGR
ncbi:MAG: Na+/H+ antiporter NhaC family protein [Lachnospiraceae bacterium]|nr:Na+/H+ antiporter NhaC family protein [Lachnospiraceae bacterium]